MKNSKFFSFSQNMGKIKLKKMCFFSFVKETSLFLLGLLLKVPLIFGGVGGNTKSEKKIRNRNYKIREENKEQGLSWFKKIRYKH